MELLKVIEIKNKFPTIKTACWNVDKRNSVNEFASFGTPSLLKLFDIVDNFYTIALGNIEEYKRVCPNTKVSHLQQGCDLIAHKTEELTQEDHDKYDCDVMFAGMYPSGCHQNRTNLINFLKTKPINFKIFGGPSAIYDTEHNKASQCAKI